MYVCIYTHARCLRWTDLDTCSAVCHVRPQSRSLTTYSHLSYRRNGSTRVSFRLVSSSSCYPIVIQIGRSILYRPIARRKTHNSLVFVPLSDSCLSTWQPGRHSRHNNVTSLLDWTKQTSIYQSLHVFCQGGYAYSGSIRDAIMVI